MNNNIAVAQETAKIVQQELDSILKRSQNVENGHSMQNTTEAVNFQTSMELVERSQWQLQEQQDFDKHAQTQNLSAD